MQGEARNGRQGAGDPSPFIHQWPSKFLGELWGLHGILGSMGAPTPPLPPRAPTHIRWIRPCNGGVWGGLLMPSFWTPLHCSYSGARHTVISDTWHG